MNQSRRHIFWRLVGIASWCGVLSSALIAFAICSLGGFSLVQHNERLLRTIPRSMADEVHVVLDTGQLQIGTQTDVEDLSDWIRQIRTGTADFGYPVTATFDIHFGQFQLSWIRFAGSDPTFGFACPVFVILVPLMFAVWVMKRLGQHSLRRTNLGEEDIESI